MAKCDGKNTRENFDDMNSQNLSNTRTMKSIAGFEYFDKKLTKHNLHFITVSLYLQFLKMRRLIMTSFLIKTLITIVSYFVINK